VSMFKTDPSNYKNLYHFTGVPVTVYSRSRHHSRILRCDVYARMWRDGTMEMGPVCYPAKSNRELPEYMLADQDGLKNLIGSMFDRMTNIRASHHEFYVGQSEGRGWWK